MIAKINESSFNFRMKNQFILVALLLVIVASLSNSLPADNDNKIDEKENEIEIDNEKLLKPDPKIPKAFDTRFNKMLPESKLNDNQLEIASKVEKVQKKSTSTTTETAVKDETSTIGKHNFLASYRSANINLDVFSLAFVPYKDDELKKDMLKDVSHADVAKSDDTIDETDPNYEDYYDVKRFREFLTFNRYYLTVRLISG